MAEYKEKDTFHCRVCGERLQPGDAVEWVKFPATPKHYFHTDCLKKKEAQGHD